MTTFGSITPKELCWVASLAQTTTNNAFRYQGSGSDYSGAYYSDHHNPIVWEGRKGGRTNATAYYFGGLMEWVRLAKATLVQSQVTRLQEIHFKGVHARTASWHVWEQMGRDRAKIMFAKEFVRDVTNLEGRTFAVQIIPPNDLIMGEKYGPTVQVFDRTYPELGEFGQFTGGSAYMIELVHSADTVGGGWVLDGGIPVWHLSDHNMRRLNLWFKEFMSAEYGDDQVNQWFENARTNFWWA